MDLLPPQGPGRRQLARGGHVGDPVGPPNSGLDNANRCFTFVLMEVETLGIARSLGWRVHMRCADGYREGTKSIRRGRNGSGLGDISGA